jgi:uncharacterized hydrophobic protein (TIGR00271 family)
MTEETPASNAAAEGQNEEREKERRNQLFRRFKVFVSDLIGFLRELMSIRQDTDYERTREGIVKDIPFRGPTIYILICSIFIASIGLNLNSPAVIIGAMLIAPLMGPILGAGFALGTNDSAMLIKALKNFGVMTAISLVTSTAYFMLTPLVEYQPELLARTKPTTLDIFVAIFGGIAGIVAGSRKEKSNVIPGVAIATALMPPLCTAGFGLATGNMAYFFGAFYLFVLNSIFICAATVVGVRYLKFPVKEYVNRARERKVKLYMALFMTIIILPSLWIFWGVLKESYFKSQATAFVASVLKAKNSRMINSNFIFDDENPRIEVFMIGDDISPDTLLDIYGNNGMGRLDDEMASMQGRLRADIVEDLFSRSQEEIFAREKRIEELELQLSKAGMGSEKIGQLSKELKIQFDGLERISYANTIETDFTDKVDTIPTFLVRWNKNTSARDIAKNEKVLGDLMKVRLTLDTVRVIRY